MTWPSTRSWGGSHRDAPTDGATTGHSGVSAVLHAFGTLAWMFVPSINTWGHMLFTQLFSCTTLGSPSATRMHTGTCAEASLLLLLWWSCLVV